MSGVDLHPEDLLEADARGALSLGERERLEWHLDQCEVCRFERLARKDFRRELEDQDDGLDVSRLLTEALSGGTQVAATPRSSGRRKGRVRLGLLAAAMVTIAGTAAAAVGLSEMRVILPRAFDSEAGRAVGLARTGVERGPAPAGALTAAPPADVAPAPAPSASIASPSSNVLIELQSPSTEAAGIAAPPPLPARSSAVGASGPTRLQRDAVALFARANGARRLGDRELATRLYRELIEQYRSSPEAHQAEAVLGQTLLDSSDPEGALRCFEDYLEIDGALREDVTRDRAIALERLGRADEEASAWTALLQAYPNSVHGDRARKRLSDLGKR